MPADDGIILDDESRARRRALVDRDSWTETRDDGRHRRPEKNTYTS